MSRSLFFSLLIIIGCVIAAGVWYFWQYSLVQPALSPAEANPETPFQALVEEKGTLALPSGLPSGLPVKSKKIVDSAVTTYPGQDARQISLSYIASGSPADELQRYREYMKNAGYAVEESSASSEIHTLFGTADETNLSVAISGSTDGTLVQISYLIK